MLWIYAGMAEKLPAAARAAIDERGPRISPIAALELKYLHEIGRAGDPLPTMLTALKRDLGLEVDDAPASELAFAAVEIEWTRDPFDRLIAAHAIVADAPLVTADETILANLAQATWA